MDEARVNVTYNGGNGDLQDPVSVNANTNDIRTWVQEAIATGSIVGIPADPNADLRDFVVDRFPPTDVRPYTLFSVRPKTPFG